MKIVMINSGNIGSTGNIMLEIANLARLNGDEVYTACANGKSMKVKKVPNHIYIGSRLGRNVHILLATVTGLNGMFSILDTIHFIKKLKRIQPDIIHLHNLHNCYINLPLFFNYIKKNSIQVVWTLHDCWAFTGQCPHFSLIKCEKWKVGCYHCPQYKEYPKSLIDKSKLMWKKKKKWFTGVKKLTIVVPSFWLKSMVEKSFLKNYSTRVIYNGIDLDVFKPTQTNIKKRLGIKEDEYMLLGVAFGWGNKKGLDVFVRLSNTLSKKIKIVLVGTDDEIDKILPRNIISIHRTECQTELAELYSAANIFVNPTREEVLGLVNLEALACGTPVITFDSGGSPECINSQCGRVVSCDDYEELKLQIEDLLVNESINSFECRKRAQHFDKNQKFSEYIALFKEIKN